MSVSAPTLADLNRWEDPVEFARDLIGQPLWDHQEEVVRSQARYRVLCAGRRAGKSRVFGVLALHRAVTKPRSKVLIVAAGETTAKRLFADVAGMAARSRLATSVSDETKSLLVFSNGSEVQCVPASHGQVRSAEADLLIVDEAGFVPQEIWEAAEPTVGARPGSRVLICSTPWGTTGHFFRELYFRGKDRPDAEVASWHWPSTVNPQLDRVWLAGVKDRSSDEYYAREYLADWGDDSGAFFSTKLLDSAVVPYELTPPEQAAGERWADYGLYECGLAGGVDWGQRDANALVVVATLDDHRLNAKRLGWGRVLYLPWLIAQSDWAYRDFIDYLVAASSSFPLRGIVSEVAGVGAYPTEDLARRSPRHTSVFRSNTTNKWKLSMFNMIRALLQRQQLVLPNEPELLKQLRGLQFEHLDGGGTRVAVPERLGHDDLVMALAAAMSAVDMNQVRDWPYEDMSEEQRVYARKSTGLGTARFEAERRVASGELAVLTAPSGLRIPVRPRPALDSGRWLVAPRGHDKGEGFN